MKYTCLSCGVDLNLANTYRENYRYCKECGPKIKEGGKAALKLAFAISY